MKPARIIVLVIAIAAGGFAALLAGRSDPPAEAPAPVAPLETADVLIANTDIGLGHTVGASDLRWQTWPAAAAGTSFIRKSERPEAIKELTGAITRASFSSGEPIRESKLIKGNGGGYMAAVLPSGMRAISTEISTETGAGGFILPNDHVDVILTRRDKVAEKNTGVEIYVSEIVLSNVKVLAIDQTVEEKQGQRVVLGKTATLELSPQQAEVLALSRQLGTISLALRSLVDFQRKDEPVKPADEGGDRRGVNVVRFGVTTTNTTK
jgi:pilus assembly protein CpaB